MIVSLWRQINRGVRALWRRDADRDVDEEVQHFVDEAAAEYEAGGMSAADAMRAARMRVGNPLSIRDEVRSSVWEHVVETLVADIRYGVRRLVRDRGFAFVTIATLGLGIGAAAAMLSVAGPVLVKTLPYPNGDRIHAIWDQSRDRARVEIAFGTFVELQARSRTLASMAVSRVWQPALTGRTIPERLDGRGVSTDYFRVFGIPPRLGRDFDAGDDVLNAPRVVILSDRLWRRRFDADAAIIGRLITLDDFGYEVIGVMPAGFAHRLMPATDVWRPLQYDRTLPSFDGREWGHHLRMVARLQSGISQRDAVAELDQIARNPVPQIERPSWAAMNGLIVDSLHEDLTREARPAMLAVLAAVSLLLLIACVNVVNLLLGRDAQRRAEFAMRTALGAGRSRLIRQLAAETMVLAGCGGLAGLLVAQAVLRFLVLLGPQGSGPAASATIETPIFLLTFGVTTLAGVIVALAPALSNADLKGGIPQGAWQAVSSHRLTRRSLVVAEIAFTLVLLVGAGLLFQSLRHLFAIAPGFDERQVLVMQVQVAGRRFVDRAATHQFFRQTLDAVRQVPGVVDAALSSQLPLSGDSDVYGVGFESAEADPAAAAGAAFRYAVSPGYFEAMRIPLLRGRSLSEQDHGSSPPAVVISQSLAQSHFPNGDPIGQRLHAGPVDRPWMTVVGVVGNVKQSSLETDWFDAVYVTPEQWHFADRALWLVIRARGDAASLTAAAKDAVWSVDKDQPIVGVSTFEGIVAATARERRFALLLFEAFGLTALLLTAVGIYGVVSSGVADRVREIGVRTALGASRAAILRMVMREGASMASLGILIGVAVAAASTRGLTALLFGVSRFDPIAYISVALTLITVAVLACWIPARRAARIDPAVTLRAE